MFKDIFFELFFGSKIPMSTFTSVDIHAMTAFTSVVIHANSIKKSCNQVKNSDM